MASKDLSKITQKQRDGVALGKAAGLTNVQIANMLGLDEAALVRHFKRELDTGNEEAISAVAKNLYRIALGDGAEAVRAAMFWLKTRGKWKETTHHDITSSDGSLMPTRIELVSPLKD